MSSEQSEVERTTDEQKRTDNKQVDDVTSKMADADLDSDDDLEPFDLSNDTPVTSHAAPRYVRQCMEGEGGCRIVYDSSPNEKCLTKSFIACFKGLIDQENPNRVEVCLKSASKLIRTHTHMAKEVCAFKLLSFDT